MNHRVLTRWVAISALLVGSAPAKADNWGCSVLLCMAHPQGYTYEPQCSPHIQKLLEQLSGWNPSFPACTLSNGEESASLTRSKNAALSVLSQGWQQQQVDAQNTANAVAAAQEKLAADEAANAPDETIAADKAAIAAAYQQGNAQAAADQWATFAGMQAQYQYTVTTP